MDSGRSIITLLILGYITLNDLQLGFPNIAILYGLMLIALIWFGTRKMDVEVVIRHILFTLQKRARIQALLVLIILTSFFKERL